MKALRWQWRPLWPGELDHERLWLAVSAASGGLAVAAVRTGFRLPPCAFHLLTGFPCPGCGSTRAVVQLVSGHLAPAWHFNPLTTAAIFSIAAFDLYAIAVLTLGLPRLRPAFVSPGARLSLRASALAAIAGNWIWVLVHGL